MLRPSNVLLLRTTLALGLTLGAPALTWGQGASLSSGSGRGTGTGTGAGASTFDPGTGSMTGAGSLRPNVGLGGPRPNMGGFGNPFGPSYGGVGGLGIGGPGGGGTGGGPDPFFSSPLLLRGKPGRDPQGYIRPIRPPYPPTPPLGAPFGAGSRSTLPTDPSLPLDALPGSRNEGMMSQAQVDQADAEMLPRARAIADPTERSLALDRVARTKIFTRKYRDASIALEEAGKAALEMPAGLVRDLRIMAVVTSLDSLASEEVRQGSLEREALFDEMLPPAANFDQPTEEEQRTAEARARADRERTSQLKQYWVGDSQYLWRYAATLSASLSNRNYQSETLAKIVRGQSNGSLELARAAASLDPSATDAAERRNYLEEMADRALVWADGHARAIPMPAWRDQALLTIVANAASSDQFDRALEIARTIPNAEFKAIALGRVADAQARRGRAEDATRSYNETVRAVASIPLDDPRDTLIGVLIDSLITVGRFDDARATVALYRRPSQQLIALGAVAQQQGQRGQAADARRWIAGEVSPEYRSRLLRRVEEGVLLTVNSSRSSQSLGVGRGLGGGGGGLGGAGGMGGAGGAGRGAGRDFTNPGGAFPPAAPPR